MTTHPQPTPETASHSPLPWNIDKLKMGESIATITSSDERINQRFVCTALREDAAFIVTACNQHDRLTAQNRRLVDALRKADRIVLDRAAGGKMLTAIQAAGELHDQIRTLLTEIAKEGGE